MSNLIPRESCCLILSPPSQRRPRAARTGTAVGELWNAILRTTDGGDHWMIQPSGVLGWPLFGVAFVDVNTGWAVGRDTIVRTIDGGENWTILTSDWGDLRGVSFVDASSGWAVGTSSDFVSGIILHTSDGGATWMRQSFGMQMESLWAVSFVDAQNGTAVGGGGTILHTIDGGLSWTRQNSGTGDSLFGVSFVDPQTGTAIGGHRTIVRTTNGGDTWEVQMSGANSTLYAVSFVDGVGTAVGALGTILRNGP